MDMNQAEQVKCAQLDLLIELKRICEKYSISYFLVGGTLIGAIRHNGFIPWDDDIDVGMLRCDYDRFIEVCKTDLDPEYALYDWDIDQASPIPFHKLKIKGTHYSEVLMESAGINDEIFIDVFPLDNAPSSVWKQFVHGKQCYFVKKILLLQCGVVLDNGSQWKKMLYSLLKMLSNVRDIAAWKSTFRKIQMRYNATPSDYVVNLCGAYSYKREMKARNLLEDTIMHRFENEEVAIPKAYDQYLTEVYGDYMKLPPESQRHGRHNISFADLGEYKVRNFPQNGD